MNPHQIEGHTVKYFDLQLTGDPTRARATVQQALEGRQFNVAWVDEWTGTAERGSKVANALAGAFAQYMKVEVAVRSATDPGAAVVRVSRGSRGFMGGAIGVARTNKNMRALCDELEAIFFAAGVLQSVTKADK